MKVLYISLILVITDQFTKLMVKGFSIPFLHIKHTGMYLGQQTDIFGSFLRLTYIENPGMAFGFYPGVGFKLFISLFSLAASIGIIYYIFTLKDKKLLTRIALAFILGGAIGNLIDRALYGVIFHQGSFLFGSVVDFIDVDFFNINILGRYYDRFPVFNIADASVTIGVLMLLIFYKQTSKEEAPEVEAENKITTNETEDSNTKIES